MPDNARIVEKAMALRAAAPGTWSEFVLAMREYAAMATSEVLKHPPETLLRAQGAAIMANEIATVLNMAPQLYEKTKDRKQPG
jgi:hypothetical protein